MKLVLLGAPGAGKGTQGEILTERLGIPIISTGNILREAVRNATPVGLKAKDFMDKGQLVPDDVIIGIMAERTAREDCANGYILDGVPRNASQAEMLEANGITVDRVLLIDVADEVIERRMTGRRTCSKCSAVYHIISKPPKVEGICDLCGGELVVRADDKPETVRDRLAVYHSQTEPLIEYYGDKVVKVSVPETSSVAETSALVLKALGID